MRCRADVPSRNAISALGYAERPVVALIVIRRLLADNPIRSGEFLTRELRESYPYLVDEGWHQVAKLVVAAADEIERLNTRVRQLESRHP